MQSDVTLDGLRSGHGFQFLPQLPHLDERAVSPHGLPRAAVLLDRPNLQTAAPSLGFDSVHEDMREHDDGHRRIALVQ